MFNWRFINRRKILFCAIGIIIAACILVLGIWLGCTKFIYHVEKPAQIDFSLFWDAYNKLSEKFIDTSKISDKKIIYGSIEGMTRSLGDPYTEFFNPDQAKKFQQDLAGSFDGIGVEIGIKKDLLTVISPLKGTPGQKAGLKSGDIILKIDGQDATSLTTTEAVDLIRGPKGTPVTITILRDGWTLPKDIQIIRDTIKVPSMEWSIKDGDAAYIQIYQFDEQLPADFSAAALQILNSSAKEIVVDLRDNPGGYLSVAQDIAGWFLPVGKVVTIEDFGKGKKQQIYKAEGNAQLSTYPVNILINQGSASASEILAGALRDNRGIKLIGTKSFGKGSVQEVIDLKDGSFIKVTIAHWLTPKGNSISEVGLTPDVKVEITDDDISQKKDPQLDKALELIEALP